MLVLIVVLLLEHKCEGGGVQPKHMHYTFHICFYSQPSCSSMRRGAAQTNAKNSRYKIDRAKSIRSVNITRH